MNSVVQTHEYGCGVACLAFIAGLSYEKAIKTLGARQAADRGFYCKELVEGLQKLSINYECRYIKPRLRHKVYQDGTIVFIKRSKRYPAGHYLVRHRSDWMDPWINFTSNLNITEAKAGFRKRLPGRPMYALLPKS